MTFQPVATLLRQMSREPIGFITVTGCQTLHHEATLRYNEISQQITVVESRLKMLSEMASECRLSLQNWHTKPSCSRNKRSCRNGSCGCSYRSFVQLWSLLELQKAQENLLGQLRHEASSYRYLAESIISSRLKMACENAVYVTGFTEIMHLTGDISDDEWDFIKLYCDDVSLGGPPYELRLTVKTYGQSLQICWDESSNRINS
ncbi:hypothetical protein GX865_00285 [Candidatus Saccharibacteria bacterium]|nr:hypothetical protein [Candidatus Saccharibacteria bacterium]